VSTALRENEIRRLRGVSGRSARLRLPKLPSRLSGFWRVRRPNEIAPLPPAQEL